MKAITMGALARGFELDNFIDLTEHSYPGVFAPTTQRYFRNGGNIENDEIISYVAGVNNGIRVIGVYNIARLTFRVIPYDANDGTEEMDDWSGQEAFDWFVRQQHRAEGAEEYFMPETAISPRSGDISGSIRDGEIIKRLVYQGKNYEEIISFLDSISLSVDPNNRYFDTWTAVEDDVVPEDFYHSSSLPECIYTEEQKEQRKLFWRWYSRIHKVWQNDTYDKDDDSYMYAYFSKFIDQANLNECIHIIEMYEPQESNGRIREGIGDAFSEFQAGMYRSNNELVNTLVNRVCYRASERVKQLMDDNLNMMSEGYYKYVKQQLQHTGIELPKFKMIINHKILGDEAPEEVFNKEIKKVR